MSVEDQRFGRTVEVLVMLVRPIDLGDTAVRVVSTDRGDVGEDLTPVQSDPIERRQGELVPGVVLK